jgi:hypothetical protein
MCAVRSLTARMLAAGCFAISVSTSRAAWCTPTSEAQKPRTTMQRLRGELELGGFLATPFEGAGGRLGIGWRFAFGIGWDRIPLTLGMEYQAAYFGESVSRDSVQVGTEELEIDTTRRDTASFVDAIFRLQPLDWPVRPYLEGVAGPKQLRSDYEVEFVRGSGTAATASEVDWTYTLGAGAGVDVPLGGGLWLSAGVRYLAGGQASYSRAVAHDSDATIRYHTSTATTTFSLGLVARTSAPEGS